jgi:hypothetical protein
MRPPRLQVTAIQEELAATVGRFAALTDSVDISVSSVDGYQGREADAVVFSATRNNAGGSLGFLSDPRRLNVAITRPKRALVVIGSPRMLAGDPNWGRCACVCMRLPLHAPATACSCYCMLLLLHAPATACSCYCMLLLPHGSPRVDRQVRAGCCDMQITTCTLNANLICSR